MHYANASLVQRLNEADSLIEYDPPANGTAQYNGIADSLSLQPTATRSSSAPPLPYKEGPDSSLKVPEIMQNTIADAPPSIRPYISPSIIGARSNSLHSSLGSFSTACYMVHPHYGSTPSAAHYPVAQSAIAYSTMGPSTVQQVTYPTHQSVSSNVQEIGDDSDPYPLHTAQPSNLLLGGSCGHQAVHSSSTAQSATAQLHYPEDSSALNPPTSHLHPAQYPASTSQANIYTVEGSAHPSLFNSTPYSPTVVTAGEATTNPGDPNAPYCHPYQQPYPGVYSVPIGSEGHRTQLTSSCHGRPHTHSPIIHNDLASCYSSAECNRNVLPSTGLLGQASHTLPNPASVCKFPTAAAWSSSHSALTISTSASPSHASPAHSVSSGQQEFLMGSHCSVSSKTAHSSTTTSPIAIFTPHSDSTAYLSDQRSLSQSEPQSPLSPYVQHAPGSQGTSISPHYSEYSPVMHQPAATYKGLPSNLPSTGYDAPDVGGSCAGRSPLLPIYNVPHDQSMPSHNPCHGLSHRHQRGIHVAPCYPPISSNTTDPSITMGYPALTTPVHPYHDNRSQRCFGACCSIEHDADDSDEPHAYAFIHGVRETKKRPRRKFEEIVRNYACTWTGCAKAYGTLNHLNAHIINSGHGSKRDPSEFKELRKFWRKQKQDAEMEELLRNARGRPRGRHEVVKASISQLEQPT